MILPIIAIGNLHDIAKDNEIESYKSDNINLYANNDIDLDHRP